MNVSNIGTGPLGRVYEAGEIIIRQGEPGDCMFVIQHGRVEIFAEADGKEIPLTERGAGEFFGEMAIFEHQPRSATVRALTRSRVLTVDKPNFLRRMHEDPSLSYRLVQTLSHRVRELTAQMARLNAQLTALAEETQRASAEPV